MNIYDSAPQLGLVDEACPIGFLGFHHVSHELTWQPSCRVLFHFTLWCVALVSTLEFYVGEHAPTATICSCGSVLVTLPWKPWELEALEFVHKTNGAFYITVNLPQEELVADSMRASALSCMLSIWTSPDITHYLYVTSSLVSHMRLFLSDCTCLFLSLSMSPI